MILEFDSVGSGLVSARAGALDAFAIAGNDRKWHWAKAEIKGDNIVVYSKDVTQPLAVRYAWAMNPSRRNLLYNREGFPSSPFRTDNEPLFDPKVESAPVLKPAKPKGYQAVDWKRPPMHP